MVDDFIEVKVRAFVDSGELLAYLDSTRVNGAWEEDGVIHLFWHADQWRSELVDSIRGALRELGVAAEGVTILPERVPDKDWNEEWAKSIQPIRIGRRVCIRQSWNAVADEPELIVLVLDPKRAFGTGHHATTQLMIEYLEESIRGRERVLDVGTGSGILSMVALRLGASSAIGIDNDPDAIECAREYAALNRFGRALELRVSTLDEIGEMTYDRVLANIDRNALIRLAPLFFRCLEDRGRMFISGLTVADRDEITKALEDLGGKVFSSRVREDWLALAIRKRSE